MIVFSLLCFYACSNSKVYDRVGEKIYTFDSGEDKMFFLDSMTTQETGYIQLIDDDRLAIFNKPENTICIFSIKGKKEIKKIRLYKEGPNAVLGVQGFYYQSDDSIWVYKQWEKEFILINESGEIIDKKILREKLAHVTKQHPFTVGPFPLGDMPISKIGDIMILQGMGGPGEEDGLYPATTVLYDLKSDELRIANPYPIIYGNEVAKHWNTFAYRVAPYTLNNKDEMVVSFPASDSVRVYDVHNDSYESFFAGYSLETDIKPLPTNHSRMDLDIQYLEQYQYMGILYDKHHDLYYRLMLFPTFDYDISIPSSQYKEMAIIVLNSSFEKVGEYKLGKAKYYFNNVFVTEEGLYINVPSDDDDYLRFITFKVCKNEN